MKTISLGWSLAMCAGLGSAFLTGCATPAGPTHAAVVPLTAAATAQWVRVPTGTDMLRVYPLQAQRQSLAGSAVIKCNIKRDGHLEHCIIIKENPPGMHFGDAALSLVPIFQTNMTKGTVQIPLRWQIP